MIRVHRLGYVLLWMGIATLLGHSQEGAGDYVAPSEASPRGAAPRMQVQLLSRGEQIQQYAVIFYQGDEAFSGLQEFAEKYHVTSAHFTAIGAVNGATLGWFDPKRKMYKEDSHPGSARSDRDERRHRSLPGKAYSPYAHGGGVSRRNHAGRPCSQCVCIPNAGSNAYGRLNSNAQAV